MSGGEPHVMAVFDALNGNTASLALNAQVERARKAVAELIAADRGYDEALTALKDLNRRIAEHGWMDVEHDALRKAGTCLVSAQQRRHLALEALGGDA